MSAEDPVALCLAGRISPEVALARLLLAGSTPEQIAQLLFPPTDRINPELDSNSRAQAVSSFRHPGKSRGKCGRWTPTSAGMMIRNRDCGSRVSDAAAALARLLAEHRDGIAGVVRMLAASGLAHDPAAADPEATLARLRAAFDRAVACSPEAAVAAYSLGDPAILKAATAELVHWLAAEQLVGAASDVLDLGCGIGRLAAALGPRCRTVLGLDISPAMVAEARRRCPAPNLRFEATGGRDLAGLPEARFDLVLAVDVFPYLMQAGPAVAERHVADAARLLRRGGALAVFNLSYRGDLAADRADARRWADAFGLRLTRHGEAPFALWDGTAFVLHK